MSNRVLPRRQGDTLGLLCSPQRKARLTVRDPSTANGSQWRMHRIGLPAMDSFLLCGITLKIRGPPRAGPLHRFVSQPHDFAESGLQVNAVHVAIEDRLVALSEGAM